MTEAEARSVGEHAADLVQSLQWVVAAVVRAVAVGPLIVAGGIDQRVGEAVEVAPDAGDVGIAALGRAALDVTEVVDQGDGGVRADLVDDAGKGDDLLGAVGVVADDGEGVPATTVP